jgi:putative transposase
MFISKHKDAFGVEPVCRVLTENGWQIAPGTYYAAGRRPPSARAVRDAQVRAEIVRMRADYEEVYGARKTWLELNRRGIPAARCTVERVMREDGLRGARRGRKVRTTIPGRGPGHERAADLIVRDFTAPAPDRRWVADFTHVATLAGPVYVAFVVDIFSRMLAGWAAARHKRAKLVLDALDMAPRRAPGQRGPGPSLRRRVAVHLHRVHRPPGRRGHRAVHRHRRGRAG